MGWGCEWGLDVFEVAFEKGGMNLWIWRFDGRYCSGVMNYDEMKVG